MRKMALASPEYKMDTQGRSPEVKKEKKYNMERMIVSRSQFELRRDAQTMQSLLFLLWYSLIQGCAVLVFFSSGEVFLLCDGSVH